MVGNISNISSHLLQNATKSGIKPIILGQDGPKPAPQQQTKICVTLAFTFEAPTLASQITTSHVTQAGCFLLEQVDGTSCQPIGSAELRWGAICSERKQQQASLQKLEVGNANTIQTKNQPCCKELNCTTTSNQRHISLLYLRGSYTWGQIRTLHSQQQA